MTQNIENLVFEGGGIRCIAFCGALQKLLQHGLLNNIKRIAGSSAGAITAGLISVGYTPDELYDILWDLQFKNFQDKNMSIISNIYGIVKNYGIHKGEYFLNWYGNLLKKKTGNRNITFQQLYDEYKIELVVTGTNLTKSETVYFHYKKYPNVQIKDAVRISMSIPIFFASVELQEKISNGMPTIKNGKKNTEYGGIYVDGGILNNYPIFIFDNDILHNPDYVQNKIHISDLYRNQTIKPSENKTLGLKLLNEFEKASEKLYTGQRSINHIGQYLHALIETLLLQCERGFIKQGYWERTIPINTFNIRSIDFDIDDFTKTKLINSGFASAEKFINLNFLQENFKK